ncbi:MAG: hypothetical protein KJ970_03300 [Candidatus Eisenbacteria bacterium]|uniref:Endonuclease/exonuclease/phosphatase domain-containing protein n=1 Tax=Eiseniibacteriota bacterium TaxID=2212470 RepID=A0A948RUY6_UNCEI|nr:hypothetical protein [Candidatus Eisenbacteria bacterium]MBU1948459.1 hypothetical protein [Candidatus Eisenbacteria bacterium]MBU2689927.1 hypothetical protein [Candidatus Eisenbacteria bacterium]
MTIILVLVLPGWTFAAEYIRIASFNIAEFGEGNHPATRDLSAIAHMLVDNELDLIAVQEVGTIDVAEDQVAALTDTMNALTPVNEPDYFFVITPQSGDERYAAIYRDPVIYDDEVWWLEEDRDSNNPKLGGKNFFRIPAALPFQAGDFDFVIVPVHLAWGDLGRRKQEIKKLRDFLRGADQLEGDWIVLGDMNRYGKYKKTDKKAFDQLLEKDWQERYRFPLLEAITDPHDMKVWIASQDEFSTTVASSRNIYDQFIITRGVFAELGTGDPEFGVDIGIVAFDMQPPYTTMSHNAIKYTVSDHRPIWIRFQIDLGDDD